MRQQTRIVLLSSVLLRQIMFKIFGTVPHYVYFNSPLKVTSTINISMRFWNVSDWILLQCLYKRFCLSTVKYAIEQCRIVNRFFSSEN